ncbi:MAG: heterocyst differentiation related protein, partial [Cyanobacteria bacterium J06632_19]
MSESMAFIGGVAVAGLAALLLLKGSGNSLTPNFNTPQVQSPVVAQPY